MYELFVTLHIPISLIFIAMMFWHCNNFLTSWHYLISSLALWGVSYLARVFYLNWLNPFRLSFLIGEESAVTILPDNAVKVTIPTQMKWRPGQYVYLRMPGISMLQNHPFTIASLCSDDFPSSYGSKYRDMTLVFRPFDGPYGGVRRELSSFDDVVFFAGGSGITAIASQLLDLIKRMRDGKARTRTVKVVWALKRPDTMDWFKEELRICRECAPPNSMFCNFYLTGAKRYDKNAEVVSHPRPQSGDFHDKLNDVFQGVASKRNSAYIREEAGGDEDKERELRRENEDSISALPNAHLAARPRIQTGHINPYFPETPNSMMSSPEENDGPNFGFPSTPTMLQKNLMRFAFFPRQKRDGWKTEYGRPDIPFMLKQFSKEFGRRTCVFVCGPPSMRVDVANTVAKLQTTVMNDPNKDELFLHTENYAI
ncbi:hypothetical protein TRV_05840 [Trichophyton verrucosum HKI 0517]|uniref:ferric-chelate reductase (NADPH) n=1 Tax=Trichophyton verrucosum (strain HKI 0517) TaxID=663202 RepID=D4DF94_TRIVH|nr:uncharacterized protein TRV_05840 [Trichophyton verrucosum HKI 0517]EFE39443.1 hypothetical protein TRV_05840 [Trichophyton verrucosum HKI 0517]